MVSSRKCFLITVIHSFVAEEAFDKPVRNQSDGGAHAERSHTVLRVCAGATKSALSEHFVF